MNYSKTRKLINRNPKLLKWCKKLPKSVFFSIEPQKCDCEQKCAGDLPYKWTYKNGVFPGYFDNVLGKGGEGIVIQGEWHRKDAAFKFTPVKHTKSYQPPSRKDMENFFTIVDEACSKKKLSLEQALTTSLGDSRCLEEQFSKGTRREDTQEYAQENLEQNLNEVFKIQSTMGSSIVKPYGHYRYFISEN